MLAGHRLTKKFLLELVELVVGVYLAIKYVMWVIFQCIYEHYKLDPNFKHMMDKVQDWLRRSGSLYRSLGGLGVFLNIIFSAIAVCFYFPNLFGSRPRRFRALRESLPNEFEVQRERVHKCLMRMIISSEIHARERGCFATGSILAKMNVQRLAQAARLHRPKLSSIDEHNLRPVSYQPRPEPFSFYHIHSGKRKSSVTSTAGSIQ